MKCGIHSTIKNIIQQRYKSNCVSSKGKKNMKDLFKKVFEEKMEDGTLETIMGEQIEKFVKEMIADQFRWNGECKKAFESKIKEALLPCVQEYNFERFLPKLDILLTQISNNCRTSEYKNLIENFEKLNKPMFEKKQIVTLENLMKIYAEYASKDVDTSNLEIDYDGGVSYENLTCNVYFEELEKSKWSSYDRGIISFECEEDENLSFGFEVEKYEKDKEWEVRSSSLNADIKSIANISNMQLMVENLCYADCKIDLTETEYQDDDVEVEAEPEARFS